MLLRLFLHLLLYLLLHSLLYLLFALPPHDFVILSERGPRRSSAWGW
jgi:hypothetical protein